MISTQRINEQFKIVALHTAGKQALFLLVFLLFFVYSHFNRFNSSSLINQNFFSSFGFLVTLASILYSIAVFDRLRSRHAGLYYLMVPATAFEKFVVSLIYTTVIIFLVYTLSFFFGARFDHRHLQHDYSPKGTLLFPTVDRIVGQPQNNAIFPVYVLFRCCVV